MLIQQKKGYGNIIKVSIDYATGDRNRIMGSEGHKPIVKNLPEQLNSLAITTKSAPMTFPSCSSPANPV